MSAETWMRNKSPSEVRRKGAPSRGNHRRKGCGVGPSMRFRKAGKQEGRKAGRLGRVGPVSTRRVEVRASGHTEELKSTIRAMGSHGRVHRRGVTWSNLLCLKINRP